MGVFICFAGILNSTIFDIAQGIEAFDNIESVELIELRSIATVVAIIYSLELWSKNSNLVVEYSHNLTINCTYFTKQRKQSHVTERPTDAGIPNKISVKLRSWNVYLSQGLNWQQCCHKIYRYHSDVIPLVAARVGSCHNMSEY